VRLPKFHGHWNRELQHEAARRLKELNPSIQVYAYFPASYRFDRDDYGRDTFRPEWVLYDRRTNEPIRQRRKDEERGSFVDLSNPDYRRWALGIIADWMRQAPYAGIHFDSANPLEETDLEGARRKDWKALIGPDKVKGWNTGMRDLLLQAKRVVGPDGKVTYNGIAPTSWRANRNLGLLDVADGAMNERFCVDHRGQVLDKEQMLEDVGILVTYGGAKGKEIYEKVNGNPERMPGSDRMGVARYCLGVFLLGHQPGQTFFKFGSGYSAKRGEIQENALEIDLPLGKPVAPYAAVGLVYGRQFELGWVYVNMEKTAQSVNAPERLVLMNDNRVGKTYSQGERVSIPPENAAFLLRP